MCTKFTRSVVISVSKLRARSMARCLLYAEYGAGLLSVEPVF
jgi:hypothetical protein